VNFAEQLKSQLNIVQVIEQYAPLKRQGSGQRWKGLCPFHSEKTASFNVDGALQFYKCFGCDAKGDVFTFIQQIESLTFPEALRLLADRYGIPIPERHRFDDPEAQRHAALLELCEAAATLFQDNLRTPRGAETRAYLESRGVSADSMREFRLGLADPSGQQLLERLKRVGEPLLLEAGLVAQRPESTGVYDRFRGRLMFPIHNASGKVIAFAGRALRKTDNVKYVNSPETKLYKKSTVLYNLHRAAIAARKNDRMILVEGYMDVIGIYAAGIQEVVALCGTALAPSQIRAIKQQISYQSGKGHIILNLDPDAAGSRSTEKHIAPLLANGLRVKVLEIPGGLDPDEFIQNNGADAYRELLEKSPSYFHWLMENARTKFDMRTAEGRVDAFKSLLPAVEYVHDPIERGAISREIAEQLKVDHDLVRGALRLKTRHRREPEPRRLASAVSPNERLLIACMLASADARTAVRHFLLKPGANEVLERKPIFDAIIASDRNGQSFSITQVLAALDEREQQILTEIGFSESGVREEHAAEQAVDCLRLLEARSREAKREELKQRIRTLELEGKLEEALRVAGELDHSQRPSGIM
jgi:DNA primase